MARDDHARPTPMPRNRFVELAAIVLGLGPAAAGLSALPGEFLGDTFVDETDRLWATTRDADVFVLSGGRVDTLAAPAGGRVPMSSFTGTSDGAAWLGGPTGLLRVEPGDRLDGIRITRRHGLDGDRRRSPGRDSPHLRSTAGRDEAHVDGRELPSGGRIRAAQHGVARDGGGG